MAAAIVYVCPTIGNATADASGVPACSDGIWQVVEIVEPFDLATFDPAAAAAAFSAGFLILGTGLVLATAVRLIVRAVKDA